MIENAIDNILTKLAERDYWDIEVLWNRFGVELPILELLDSEGLIELRKVSLYQDTNTTERTKLKPWYSPTSTSESWWKYFPRTSSDRKQRKPWRTVLPHSKVKIFDLFKNSPVELRVSVAGRKMLTHRVAMSAQRKLMQVNDAQLHASISSVDAILSRPVTVDPVAKKVPNSKNDRKSDGNALDSQPTMDDLCRDLKLSNGSEMISHKTFKRIRTDAKIPSQLPGIRPSRRRYTPAEIGSMIKAVRSIPRNDSGAISKRWEEIQNGMRMH